jgi:Trypsin-like peptidase domain
MRRIVLCVLTVAACQQTSIDRLDTPLIGGNDSRRDVYAHPDPWLRDIARNSVAAMIPTIGLDTTDPSNVRLVTPPYSLGTRHSLCPGQRFADDPTSAHCTAFLIGPDTVMTDLHCVGATCGSGSTAYSFVFNYLRDDESGALHRLTTADVFSCDSVLAHSPATGGPTDEDWAIVRLDRLATPRFQPIPLHRGPTTSLMHHQVAVIGSPSGIPLKIANDGIVTWDDLTGDRPKIFEVDGVDMLGGNSGSPLIDLADYTAVGLLFAGPIDPEYIPNGSCNVVNTVPDATSFIFGDFINVAIDGYCSGLTPPKPSFCNDGIIFNDQPTSPFELDVSEGREQIVAGTTTRAAFSMAPPCGGSGAPDVFYRFYLGKPSLVYADSFTSDYDTVLFFTDSTSGATPGYACNDDICGFRQSQIVQRLDPGVHYLAVSGYNGATGRYAVHFQVVPVAIAQPLPAGGGSGTVFSATTFSTDGVAPACGIGTSRDTTLYTLTCPGAQRGWANFSTCGGASWDTVLAYRSGNMPAWSCNDDSCGLQSSVWTTVTAGSGLHAITVDGYGSAFGSFNLSYTLPNVSVHAGGTSTTPARGTGGGTPFSSACPSTAVMIGIDGTVDAGPLSLTPLCSFLGADGSIQPYFTTTPIVAAAGGTSFHELCPMGQTVVGIQGSADSQLRSFGVVCAPWFEWLSATESTKRSTWGTTGSGVFADNCYSGQVVQALQGMTGGGAVTQLSATCVDVY